MNKKLDNPFVGPRTFEEKDKHLFRGRDTEARQLLSMVLSERLVLFYAQSGAGKSSLVNARLRPALKEKQFKLLPTGRVGGSLPDHITEVGNIFIFNLISSLAGSEARAEQFTHTSITEFLETHFQEKNDDEEEDEDDLIPARFLIIDQFEEIVNTNLAAWEDRPAFFKQLAQAMRRDKYLWVLLVMREDHLAEIEPYARLVPSGMRKRFYMQRLKRKAALKAIVEPAQDAGRPFTRQAANYLADNLRQLRTKDENSKTPSVLGEFIEPVQLQVVCSQLWENLNDQLQPPDNISTEDLIRFGDIDKALAQFYESTISSVINETGTSEIALRQWFDEKLITEAGTRGTVYQGQETTGGMKNDVVHLLADKYLLHAEPRAGGLWFELIHDRFVSPILQANQDWRGRQGWLIQAALDWDEANRVDAKLLVGRQFDVAKEKVGLSQVDPLVATFLAECAKAEAALREKEAHQQRELELERRRVRSTQIALGVSVGFIILSLILAGMAVRSSRLAEAAEATAVFSSEQANISLIEAEEARSAAETSSAEASAERERAEDALTISRARLHIVQAEDAYPDDPLLGIRLALEGLYLYEEDPDIFETTRNLIRAGRTISYGNDVLNLSSYVLNEALFILEHDEGPEEIWHPNVSEPLVSRLDPVENVFFSNNGQYIVVDYPNKPGELRLAEDGSIIAVFTHPIENVFFSPDNAATKVVVDYEEEPAEIWDIANNILVEQLRDEVLSIDFAIDGSVYIVNYEDPNTDDELRQADGNVVTGFGDAVSGITFYPDSHLFSFKYPTSSRIVLRQLSNGEEPEQINGREILDIRFDPNAGLLIIDYFALDTPDEVIRLDGSLLTELSGDILDVSLSPDRSVFIVDYLSSDVTDELRSVADGRVLLEFGAEVSNVHFSPNSSVFWTKYAEPDSLTELRRTDDGTTIVSFINVVQSITFSADDSVFLVNYEGDFSGELRRSEDGSVIISLQNSISYVTFYEDAQLVQIAYRDADIFGEVRRITDGELIYSIQDDSNNLVFSTDPGSLLFGIQPEIGPAEVRRLDTGEAFPLSYEVADITFSPDGTHFFADYVDQTISNELRDSSDGEILISDFFTITYSTRSSLFVIDFLDPDKQDEVRSTTDDNFVFQLPESISGTDISNLQTSAGNHFFVIYYKDQSANIYQTTGYQLFQSFNDLQVESIVFDNDININRSLPPGNRIDDNVTDANGDPWTFFGSEGGIVTLDMRGDFDTYLEIFNEDGDRIAYNDDDDVVSHSRIEAFSLPYTGAYTIIARGYLGATGNYTLIVEGATSDQTTDNDMAIPAAHTYAVYFSNNDRVDVWSVESGEQLVGLSDVSSIVYSPDPERSLFEVSYKTGLRELYDSSEGKLVTQFGNILNNIIYSSDENATYLIAEYENDIFHLHLTTNGQLITRFSTGEATRTASMLTPQSDSPLFILRYAGDNAELYHATDGRKITDLPGDAYQISCYPELESNTCILAYTNDTAGELRGAETGEFWQQLPGVVRDIQVSPNKEQGIFFVIYEDGTAELRQMSNGDVLQTLGGVEELTFSNDALASFLIVNYDNRSSEIWHTNDWQLLQQIEGKTISQVLFNNDENRLFINYDDTTAEMRRSSDGTLVGSLSGEVSGVTLSPDGRRYIINYVEDGLADEIRRVADSGILAELPAEVQSIVFSDDPDAPFFVINYFEAFPEVRRMDNGTILISLEPTNESYFAFASPEDLTIAAIESRQAATIFVLTFLNSANTEVRLASDGSLVSHILDDLDSVGFSSNPEASVFGIRYLFAPTEIWRIPDGEPLPAVANAEIITINDDESLFFVEYGDSEIPNEIRSMIDGQPFLTGYFTATFSVDTSLFVINYFDPEQPDVLYPTADETASIELTGDVSNVIFNRDKPFFTINYLDSDIPTELRNVAYGEKIGELESQVADYTFYDDLFVINYADPEVPSELWQLENMERLLTFSESNVETIRFSRDHNLFFVKYGEEKAEIYGTVDGNYQLIRTITGAVDYVTFDNDFQGGQGYLVGDYLNANQITGNVATPEGDAWLFIGQAGDVINVEMSGDFDTAVSLLSSDGSILASNDLFDSIYHARVEGVTLPYSGFYTIIARGYSGASGSYSLEVEGINISPIAAADEFEIPRAKTYTVYFANNGRSEVWDIERNQRLAALSSVSSVSFSPNDDKTLFIATYDSGLQEVFNTNTGFRLAEDVTELSFSPDNAYLFVSYDDAPGEIYSVNNPAYVTSFLHETKTIEFPDKDAPYFVVEYTNNLIEVWTTQGEQPHQITDLGPAVDDFFFDAQNQRLIVRYEDNYVYLIDLAFLETMSMYLTADASPSSLIAQTCESLFSSEAFENSYLDPFMERNTPLACP